MQLDMKTKCYKERIKMEFENIVLVPCHGICLNPTFPERHESWTGIYTYTEEASLLYEHCKAGVTISAANSSSILIFSGGATHKTTSKISEASSYRDLALAANWWGFKEVGHRIILESYSRDSLQKLIFSISLFSITFGYYPKRIMVAGFKFKEMRSLDHVSSIGWNKEFMYYGVNDPPQQNNIYNMANKGERLKREVLKSDPFLQAAQWKKQRLSRNPFKHNLPNFDAVPELRGFLNYLYLNGPKIIPTWRNYEECNHK